MRYTIASAINLAILTLGIGIGAFFAPHITRTASANPIAETQAVSGQDQIPVPLPKPADTTKGNSGTVDYVSATVTLGGPVATNTLLANRIACDNLQVNGFDTLKLYDAILSLLAKKGIATQADINAVIAAGKADRPLRIRQTQ